MLYQKLLMGTKPYFIHLEHTVGFELHRHPDLELNYCLKGSYDIQINSQTYTMKEGNLAIIGSLIPHAYLPSSDVLSLTIEVGPVFLKEYFRKFTTGTFAPVYHFGKEYSDSHFVQELQSLLFEIADACQNRADHAELLFIGNLYKICDCILHAFLIDDASSPKHENDYLVIVNIEKALDFIHAHYTNDITVDDAATLTGYGKSNFCKHFKNITGDSFHHLLNRHRIETAQYLLCETTYSLSEIAPMVGFADAKILCRVFKSFTGITPGEYRKRANE